MKKVMFFIESLAGGGAEKALVNLIKALNKKEGYELYIYTVTDEDVYQNAVSDICRYRSFLRKKNYRSGGLRKILFWLGVRFIYGAPTSLIYRLFIKEEFDAEVAFVEGFSTKLIASSRSKKSKKVAWVHIDTIKNGYADRFFKDLQEQVNAYEAYDRIVFVSDTVKKSFEEKYKISPRSQIIHNLLDIQEIIESARESIDLPQNDSLQMITVGRLEQQKGYIRLLKSLSSICNKDYSLWIIGDGSQRKELESLIKEYRLENNIKVLGFQSNPYKYISKADVMICSSYAEGYSTVISESLLLGVPVFSVECSGVVEQLEDGRLGKIVPNTDADLTEMLRDLICNPSQIDQYKMDSNKIHDMQANELAKIERLLDE